MPLIQVGPFARAENFVRGFIKNCTTHGIFMSLLQEMEEMEKIMSSETTSEPERKMAKTMYQHLEEQINSMFLPPGMLKNEEQRKNKDNSLFGT